jgi:hypothetical protein
MRNPFAFSRYSKLIESQIKIYQAYILCRESGTEDFPLGSIRSLCDLKTHLEPSTLDFEASIMAL